MDEMMEILKNLDWSPLFISIKTGIVATIFSFFLGIYAARKVVKTTPGKKAIIDGILTLIFEKDALLLKAKAPKYPPIYFVNVVSTVCVLFSSFPTEKVT